MRLALIAFIFLFSASAFAQKSPDDVARAFGFNSYQHYQQARSYCFDLYEKRVTALSRSNSCGADFQCLQREANAMFQRQLALMRSPDWSQNKCDSVMEIETASRKGGVSNKDDPRFEVVAAIRGCKYFVVEQGANHSLVEDWLCSRPRKGNTGYGDVNSYGIKEVTLDGSRCSVYVDDWLLSKSSALEKMVEKCQ